MIKIKRQLNFNTDFEVRKAKDSDERYLEGYFIRYNEETELYDNIYEEVTREAVENSIKDRDIKCLFNHDTAIVLGRTGNNTLELKSDEKGLYGKVLINQEDTQARDILARIDRGDINACSFGFSINDEEVINREDGSTKFILKDIDLYEVSPVTFPAYPTTSISARQKQINKLREEDLSNWKKRMKEALNAKSINVK